MRICHKSCTVDSAQMEVTGKESESLEEIRMEIGEVQKVRLPAFAVIGKLGDGLAEDGSSWVPPLWETANNHFEELGAVVNQKELTEIRMWGLMSDSTAWLTPWQAVGCYLAGMEVPADTPTPPGWIRWNLPAMEYLIVKTNTQDLVAITEKMLTEIIPQQGETLAAAIQEYYEPDFAAGEVVLYFPTRILNE